MLKGIDPILTPELLMHLCAMGHGEWVAVVDANFTADFLAQGKPLVRLPGLSLLRVSQAVLSVFPLDESVDKPAAYMHVCQAQADHRTPVQQQLVDLLGIGATAGALAGASTGTSTGGLAAEKVEPVERFAFYERVRAASLIVQTGESTAYGNAMFAKGVILH
jgi:L-fucose mutarotase